MKKIKKQRKDYLQKLRHDWLKIKALKTFIKTHSNLKDINKYRRKIFREAV